MKAKANFFGGALSIIIAFFFALFLARSNVPQNIASWTMWALLDAYIVITCIASGNKRPWLPLGCMLGACSVVAILFSRGEWKWGYVETISVLGAGIAFLSWWRLGPKYAIIAIILAMMISGIPAVCDAWTENDPSSWWYWGGSAFCALLSCYGAKGWTIEERLFPATSFSFSIFMTVLVLS